MPRCALLAPLLGLLLPVASAALPACDEGGLLDASSLVQQRKPGEFTIRETDAANEELHQAELKRAAEVGWDGICTTRDMYAFQNNTKAYLDEKAHEEVLRKQQVNTTMTELLAPLRGASKEGLLLLARAARPAALKLLKGELQKVTKPKKKYDAAYQPVNIGKTIKNLETDINGKAHEEEVLFKKGIEDFDLNLDAFLGANNPLLAKYFPHLKELPNGLPAVSYITDKALPVMLIHEYPILTGLLLFTRAHNKSDLNKVWTGTVVPFYRDSVPACNPDPVLKSIIGGADLMGSLKRFLGNCSASLGFHFDGPDAVPTRGCVSCVEKFAKVALNPSNSSSCWFTCGNFVSNCVGDYGLSDNCIHGMSKCLTCNTVHMREYGTCSGNAMANTLADKVDSFSNVLSEGTVLESGVSDLVVKMSEMLIPKSVS